MNKKLFTITAASLLVLGSGTAFAASNGDGTTNDVSSPKVEVSTSGEQNQKDEADNQTRAENETEQDDRSESDEKDDDENETDDDEGTEDDKDEADENEGAEDDESVDPSTVNISKEEAKEAALQNTSGKIIGTELEKDDGITAYEINVQTKNGTFYDVTVNAENGKVIDTEKEDAEDTKKNS